MSAELEARRTAATATLADYRREVADFIARANAPRPDSWMWAQRLAVELRSLLEQLVDETPDPAAGHLSQIRLVLDSFDWETDDRQYALEAIDDIMRGDR